jgi:anti-sigma-K factor RskA
VGVSEHREEHLDLCAGYALGALDDGDRRRLEAHLAEGCPQCEAALADFASGATALARSLPLAHPSAMLRARVLEAARAERSTVAGERLADDAPGAAGERGGAEPGRGRAGAEPSRGRVVKLEPRRAPAFQWVWAAAAAAFAIASVVLWNQGEAMRSELAQNRGHLTDLQRRLADDRRLLEVLGAPGVKVAEMQLTPGGVAELKAHATYDPKSRSAVIAFDNFTAPSGHDYELWALEARGVTSLGVIKVDANGHALIRLENVGEPDTLAGFAVSLEAAGGSADKHKPGGPVVMAGKFGA